jgi:hypothetical protein
MAYLVSILFLKIGLYRTAENPFGKISRYPAVHENRFLKLFWCVTELISVVPVIFFRVYLPLSLGYTVIAERYVVDTVVNMAYLTNDLGFLQSLTARIILSFIPQNAAMIYLDSNYSSMLRRRGDEVEPRGFIEFQREGYRVIAKSIGAKLIDTSNMSIEETRFSIIGSVGFS